MTFSIFPCVKMFFETNPPLVPLGGGGRGLWIGKRGGGWFSSDFKIENSCKQEFSKKVQIDSGKKRKKKKNQTGKKQLR
jgi:hypothetical protein